MTERIASFVAARIFPLVLCLAAAQGCGGETDRQASSAIQELARPSAEECEGLKLSLVKLRMQTVTADRKEHEANLEAALGPAFVASCQAHITRDEVLCGRSAGNPESLAACSAIERALP